MDTALYKKGGKKATKGKARGKRQGGGVQQEQYEAMMTPRNENMEQVDEEEGELNPE